MRREHTMDIRKMLRAVLALFCALALALPVSLASLGAQRAQADEPTTVSVPLAGVEGEETGSNEGTPTILGVKLTRSYKVTFDTDGASTANTYFWVRDGESLSSAKTCMGNATAPDAASAAVTVLPADPSKAGYAFRGWYAVDESGNITGDRLTNSMTGQVVKGDVTYKAKWLKNHTVTFDVGEGGSSIPAQTVADGEFAQLPAAVPTWTDHKFIHWYEDGENPMVPFEFTTKPITSDITLVARWEVEVKAYFYGNGGTLAAGMENPVSIASGHAVAQPADPTRPGYQFEYWFAGSDPDDPSSGDESHAYNFGTPLEDLLYLYAKWTPCVHRISYDDSVYAADGSLNVKSGTPVRSYTTSALATTVSWTPARDGYTFTGWTASGVSGVTANGSSVTIPANAAGNLKLTANWLVNTTRIELSGAAGEETGNNEADPTTLAIRLKAGDATNDANAVLVTLYPRNGEEPIITSMKKGEKLVRPQNPSLDGFDWLGWSTKADGFTEYDFNKELAGDLTLYGCWEPLGVAWTYKISFDVPAYTGAGILQTRSDEYGRITPIDIDANDLGIYRIEGYYSDAAYTTPWDFDRDVATGNMTLFAKCVTTVTLHANGGSVVADGWMQVGGSDVYENDYVYGKTGLTIPANTDGDTITRADWTFVQWCTDAGLGTPLATSAPTTSVVVGAASLQRDYYCKWDPLITFEFYKHADAAEAAKYAGTTTIAASSSDTVTMPKAEPNMASGAAGGGIAGHMLSKWYMLPDAALAASGRQDVESVAGTFAKDTAYQVKDFFATTPTEPATVKLCAAWQATVQATTATKTVTFAPNEWEMSQLESAGDVTISSTTARGLDVTGTSIPVKAADGSTPGYDLTGGFQDVFKKKDGVADSLDDLMVGSRFAFGTVDIDTADPALFNYIGANKSAGAESEVQGTISPSSGSATELSGKLRLKLADGLRTLTQSEANSLTKNADGSLKDDYAASEITRITWKVSMRGVDDHAFIFGSMAPTAFTTVTVPVAL